MTRHFLPGFIIALGLLALGLLVAFTVGRYPVTLAELVEVLVSRLAGRATAVPPAVENVVLLVRGPRVVAAAARCCIRAIRSWCWSSRALSLAPCSAPASVW
jgi:iron complex transport system permease protein